MASCRRTQASPARIELRNRVARSPQRVALQLAEHYGKQVNQGAYQPALALVARARLTELTGDATQLKMVREIVAPYLSGEKPSFGKRVYGSHYSGHLVFGELARATGEKGYASLELNVEGKGGHSSQPPESTSIGILARAITRLEDQQLVGVSGQMGNG